MNPIINNEKSRNKFIVLIEKLIRIVCTLVLWYFILLHIFEVLVLNHYEKTIQTFEFLGIISLVVFLILFLWQHYNLYMFGSLERRKPRGAATKEHVANRFSISEDSLSKLQDSSRLNVRKVDFASSYYSSDAFHGEIYTTLDTNPLVFNRQNPPKPPNNTK